MSGTTRPARREAVARAARERSEDASGPSGLRRYGAEP